MSIAVRHDASGKLVEYKVDGVAQPLDSAPENLRARSYPERFEREWPTLLAPMKRFCQDDDGLGDIIERTIGPLGGNKFKAWYLFIFGKPCKCDVRKESWNRRYPCPKK